MGPIPLPDPAYLGKRPLGNYVPFPPASSTEPGTPADDVLGNEDQPSSGSSADDDNNEGCSSCTCMSTEEESQEGNGSVDFSIPFGRFSYWPGMPSGRLKLYSKSLVNNLADGSLFFYDHISQRRIAARQDSSSLGGGKVGIVTQRGYMRYVEFAPGCSEGTPFGGSEVFEERLRMVDFDGTPFTGDVQEAPFFEEVMGDGTIIRYDGEEGNVSSITTPSGANAHIYELTSELAIIRVNRDNGEVYYNQVRDSLEYANNIFSDRPRQIWNRADGLLDFPSAATIDWYSPADITNEIDENGLFKIKAGAEPIKSWVIELQTDTNGGESQGVSVRETRGVMPSATQWKVYGDNGLLFIKGSGEEAVCSLKLRVAVDGTGAPVVRPNGSSMGAGDVKSARIAETKYRFKGENTIHTLSSFTDARIESAVRTVYSSYPFGDVKVSLTKNYGLAGEQTWLYSYETNPAKPGYGRLTAVTKPDGSVASMTYDDAGNVLTRRTPWLNGCFREIRQAYADETYNDRRLTSRSEVHIDAQGEETVLIKTDILYEEDEIVKRQTVTRRGYKVLLPEISVMEWYKEHEFPYAIGRIKRVIRPDLSETFYEYAATNTYGAYAQITSTQCDGGLVVSGKSTRTEEYVDERGDLIVVREFVHDGTDFVVTSRKHMTYDEKHRVIFTVDGMGKTETTEWGCCGPVWTRDRDGIQTRYYYSTAKKLVRLEKDAAPMLSDYNHISHTGYSYVPFDTIAAPPEVTEFEYDGMGRRISETLRKGGMTVTTRTQYDKKGRLIKTTDAMGRVTAYAYSTDDLVTTQTLPSGATRITTKYANGLLKSQTGTGQRNTYHTYSVTDEGVVSQTRLESISGPVIDEEIADGFGRTIISRQPLVQETTAQPKSSMIETITVYDAGGRPVLRQTGTMAPVITEQGRLWDNFTQRQIVKRSTGAGFNRGVDRVTEVSECYTQLPQEAWGLFLCCELELGIFRETRTTTWLDANRSLVSSDYTLVSESYDVFETLSLSRDHRGNWSWSYTDNMGRGNRRFLSQSPGMAHPVINTYVGNELINTRERDHSYTRYNRRYTATGQIATQADARNLISSSETDLLGRVVKATDSQGNITTTQYDPVTGNPSCITNALGKTICFKYDIRGRKIAEYGTATQPLCFAYDDAGRLISMKTYRASAETIATDPSNRNDGDVTSWKYDKFTGLLIRKTYADLGDDLYFYDDYNRVECTYKTNCYVDYYTYDELTGELLSVTSPSEGGIDITYQYNHLGQMTGITDQTGTRTITYNQHGEAQSETTSGLVVSELTHLYDELGQKTGIDLKVNGATVLATACTRYDGIITSAAMDGVDPFHYNHGISGLLNSMSYPNGVIKQNTWVSNANVIEAISYESTNCEAGSEIHTYDHDRLMRSERHTCSRWGSNLSQDYNYNDRGELVYSGKSSEEGCLGGSYYSYDNIGNRKNAETSSISDYQNVVYAANSLNQYGSIGNFTPQYDANGNQTRLKTVTGEWEVEYDGHDRPVTFVQGNTRIECRYDHMGRRISKTTWNSNVKQQSKLFIYDGYLQIAELDAMPATPKITRTYLWNPAESAATRPLCVGVWDRPYAMGVAVYYYFKHDAMKNVTAIVDDCGGSTAVYQYSPYGEMEEINGDSSLSAFRYSSEYHDDDLGLIYYNYRHCNPADGRWINRDPIAEQGGYNLYGFVGNNPTWKIDWLGLFTPGSEIGYAHDCRLVQRARECCRDEHIGKTLDHKASMKLTNHLDKIIYDLGSTIVDQVIDFLIDKAASIGDLAPAINPINKLITPGGGIPSNIYGEFEFKCCEKNEKGIFYWSKVTVREEKKLDNILQGQAGIVITAVAKDITSILKRKAIQACPKLGK